MRYIFSRNELKCSTYEECMNSSTGHLGAQRRALSPNRVVKQFPTYTSSSSHEASLACIQSHGHLANVGSIFSLFSSSTPDGNISLFHT